jgi:hypothetical protein
MRRHVGYATKVTLLVLSLLVSVVMAEIGSRTFWLLRYDVSIRHPSRILNALYPELDRVGWDRFAHDDEYFDVLLLGGSVIHANFGNVEGELLEQLAARGRRNVRIVNLAMPAQTSRDSWLKYAALPDARFELVVLYHGMNDVRVNNAPPDVFREDYSHYSWYQAVNTLAPYHGKSWFALPYTLHYLAGRVRVAIDGDSYLPPGRPRADWVRYGSEPRSTEPFRRNLAGLLDLASERGDRVLLMSFASYVPENYTLDAFKEQRLDYLLHTSAIELWGKKEHVIATLKAHNQVIRELAVQHPEVLFFDQESLMPKSAEYFNDVCHFTLVGSRKFVENLLGAVDPVTESQRRGR